jgi:transposase
MTGNQADQHAPPDPLQELLARALAATQVRRGRPSAFDEHAKGQLVALLSVGMSMRQAAAVLGVSHTAVQRILKADPALAEEITSARFQAQLQPLACVIREARRSWKAATWLLRYLDAKIASHEETPDERRLRQLREAEEFMARHAHPSVKQRRELA